MVNLGCTGPLRTAHAAAMACRTTCIVRSRLAATAASSPVVASIEKNVTAAVPFAAVAKDRNIDPSSISRAIAGLEQQLGVRLFQRTTRRVIETEAGRIYFDKVEPLIEELERARHAARDVSTSPSSILRVTASVVLGQTCVVPPPPDFRRAYPRLAIALILTDAVLDAIAGRIDVAIRLGPRLDVGYVGAKLFATRYRVCASPDYLAREGRPATPIDLADRRCLPFDLPGYRERWLFRDQQFSF